MKKKMSIRDLDFSNTGAWPREFKIGFCALLALFIIGFSWWFWVTDKRDELAGLDGQEASLRAEFETKQGRAANFEPQKQKASKQKDEKLEKN